MSYATFSEFNARYATKLTETEVNSHVLPFASSRLDGLLSAHFSVPFSANNQTARDLTLDLAYLLILQRSKEPQDHEVLNHSVNSRIRSLISGGEAMMTDSGDPVFAREAQNVIWSNTARYKTVFDLKDAPHQTLPADAAKK